MTTQRKSITPKNNHIRKDSAAILFDVIKYVLLTVTAIVCVLPFILIVSGSITSNETIMREDYSILPRDITMEAYGVIFKAPEDILQAYKVTMPGMMGQRRRMRPPDASTRCRLCRIGARGTPVRDSCATGSVCLMSQR